LPGAGEEAVPGPAEISEEEPEPAPEISGTDDEAAEEIPEQPDETEALPENGPAPCVPGEPTEYMTCVLEEVSMGPAEFSDPANKNDIAARVRKVVDTDAPVLKDTVMRRVFASCGVIKGKNTLEAFEKGFRAAKIKTRKQKGIVYCWRDDQEPGLYAGIRVSAERASDEICQQELRNAICYALRQKDVLEKDEVVKEASLALGYKKLGKRLEGVLLAALQWSKSSGAVVSAGPNKFRLAEGGPSQTAGE
jgi:hypothetical protein